MLSHTGDRISDTPPQSLFSGCCVPRKPFDARLVLFSQHTPQAYSKAFCYCLIFVWFLRVSASGIRPREAAVLMVPLTARLICSSSPRARKTTYLFLFCQLGHTLCFVCWPRCFFLAEIQVLVLLASLRPACSLRCISVPPLTLLSAWEQSRSSTSGSSGQLQNLQHTSTTNLSKAP